MQFGEDGFKLVIVKNETLAQRLGTTAHLSPLLMKAKRLGLRQPEDLERLAVRRGLRYYSEPGELSRLQEGAAGTETRMEQVGTTLFSNEELAVSLLSLGLPFSQQRIRMGAAMLAAMGVSAEKLLCLARQERCEPVLFHIAKCGHRVEPDNAFWELILDRLPKVQTFQPDVLPHITRFVAMTGFTRRGKETVMQWIRPRAAKTA